MYNKKDKILRKYKRNKFCKAIQSSEKSNKKLFENAK